MIHALPRGLPLALVALVLACGEEETELPLDIGGGDIAALDSSAEAGADTAPDSASVDGSLDDSGAWDGSGDSAPDSGAMDGGSSEGGSADGGSAAGAFTVVGMPDTQYYSAFPGNYKHFTGQVNWIKANLAARQIAFVSHLGDIVDSGALLPKQWTAADKAFKVLEGDLTKKPNGLVPYGAVPGNHDYDIIYIKGKPTQYLKWFGPDRYKGRSWFVGASPNKTSMAQFFAGAGKPYLHLAMEWRPDDKSITWAQELMDSLPALPVIVATHEYLGTGSPGQYKSGGKTENGGGSNSGAELYRKLVEPYPQVFMVLCGHVHGDGRRTDTTALGQTVIQVLTDYQSDPYGGNGWMQLIDFKPAAKEITFTAYSPTYKAGSTIGPDRSKSTASNHKHAFDLDGHRYQLILGRVLHYREGQAFPGGKYQGTVDTHIGSGKVGLIKPGDSHGGDKNVHADSNGDQEQGLLRFEGIVGTGAGQIPPYTTIKKAALTLTTEGLLSESGDGAKLYRMKASWKESATWKDLGGPLKAGQATEAVHDADTKGKVGSKGTRTFDVTKAVQAWVNGASNNGWAIIGNGSNRWAFRSSEWDSLAERPLLTVAY